MGKRGKRFFFFERLVVCVDARIAARPYTRKESESRVRLACLNGCNLVLELFIFGAQEFRGGISRVPVAPTTTPLPTLPRLKCALELNEVLLPASSVSCGSGGIFRCFGTTVRLCHT